VSRLLHERVEGSTAPMSVVRAAGQAWQPEATKTGRTMKRTQERRINTEFREEATAEARRQAAGRSAAGEWPAGGPAAATRATGTTRGPATSSADGPFKRQCCVDFLQSFMPTSQAYLFKLMVESARGGSRKSDPSSDWPNAASHRIVL